MVSLFTAAKSCSHPRCPLTDHWIKKVQHIHIIEYYSAIKKEIMVLGMMEEEEEEDEEDEEEEEDKDSDSFQRQTL